MRLTTSFMAEGVMPFASFLVEGKPRPQGSKRHVGNGRMIEQSKHVGAYRADIRREAATAMMGVDATTEPVHVSVTFWFKRPQSHYWGHPRKVRDGVPATYAHGVQRGDLDKLLRAVLDALTGVVFADDRQVVVLSAEAMLGPVDSTMIQVWEVEA